MDRKLVCLRLLILGDKSFGTQSIGIHERRLGKMKSGSLLLSQRDLLDEDMWPYRGRC